LYNIHETVPKYVQHKLNSNLQVLHQPIETELVYVRVTFELKEEAVACEFEDLAQGSLKSYIGHPEKELFGKTWKKALDSELETTLQ
jgi:hypothetical protein